MVSVGLLLLASAGPMGQRLGPASAGLFLRAEALCNQICGSVLSSAGLSADLRGVARNLSDGRCRLASPPSPSVGCLAVTSAVARWWALADPGSPPSGRPAIRWTVPLPTPNCLAIL